MEMLLGYSLGSLAGRQRSGGLYRKIEELWMVDDERFFAELERRENDFPRFAKELHAFCLAAGISDIAAFAGFAKFKGDALMSTVKDDDERARWYMIEDDRLLKVLVAGVGLGLFEVSATAEDVALSGVWKVIVRVPHVAAGRKSQVPTEGSLSIDCAKGIASSPECAKGIPFAPSEFRAKGQSAVQNSVYCSPRKVRFTIPLWSVHLRFRQSDFVVYVNA
jgi:hypothetical protein